MHSLEYFERLLWVTAFCGVAYTLAEPRPGVARSMMPALDAPAAAATIAWTRVSRTAESAPRFEGFNQLPESVRDSIVRLAQIQIGTPYVFGGTSPDGGFDCSGLVRFVLGQVALQLPRTAHQQAGTGLPIHRDDLKPGDLLTFGSADSVSHIGIYVGDGKYVHASSVAGRVIVSSLDRPVTELVKPFAGARRLLATADHANRGS